MPAPILIINVILEAKPALQYMVMRVRKDRRLMTFGVEKMVMQIDQGTCRVKPARGGERKEAA